MLDNIEQQIETLILLVRALELNVSAAAPDKAAMVLRLRPRIIPFPRKPDPD